MRRVGVTGLAAALVCCLWVFLLPLRGNQDLRNEKTVKAYRPGQQQDVDEPSEGRVIREFVVHQQAVPDAAAESETETTIVSVEMEGTCVDMTMEDYLTGVVLGEMPSEFHPEALKAQAVAARTYTMHRLRGGGVISTDPTVCQAYRDPESAGEAAEKARAAVEETAGQVLTYGGELISATYFSCSGGQTESAAAVWGSEIPYLVSVESPGEEQAPPFERTLSFAPEELMTMLGVDNLDVSEVSYTDGGGVDRITIGGTSFTGKELRSILGLYSTMFTMEVSADTVVFSIRGNGHRVGMSQYGAEAMAEAGADYWEILSWYYPGTELEKR